MEEPDSTITRPCCGATAHGFDRETGNIYLPHKRSCRHWKKRKKPVKTVVICGVCEGAL